MSAPAPATVTRNTEPLVEVQEVSRAYGDIEAVRALSFTLRRGEVLGFLGPNGAGKTTSMQMLTGNLAPSSGRIVIAGHDLLEQPRAAKSCIGYLPEQPPLYRELTVDEYLDYCAALHGVARARRRSARDAAKEKCGLTDVGRRLIGNLSKGYQQRVGIAQAIVHLPPLVILDEPTVGLDPIQILEIRALIRALGQEHGVILSTHILPEVQATCSRVQIMHKGQLVLNDSIDGLARRMQSSILNLSFRVAPELGALAALPGVDKVETNGERRVRIYVTPGSDPTEAVLALALKHEWGVQEVAPERATLEQIFVDLVTDDAAAGART